MAERLRWGIIGTGSIARKFAIGLGQSSTGVLTAVGSRTQDKAEEFGNEFEVPNRHGSYESLSEDPEVDAVYVATPHPAHRDNSVLCLRAGKAVLCEKPFAVNASQAEEIVHVAREESVFCMEAMWSRFHPPFVNVRKMIRQGDIGEPRMVHAHFGFRTDWNPQGRLLNPELAGGALLDVGIYPISFASMVFGPPKSIHATGHIGETNVDEQDGIILGYESGQAAVLSCAVRTNTPKTACVHGTEGSLRVENAWWGDRGATLIQANGEEKHYDLPREGNGYNYEADEVAHCIRDGKTESDVMPLDESLSIMRTLDEARRQIGLRYPFE